MHTRAMGGHTVTVQEYMGAAVTHRIERCRFIGNLVNDSHASQEVGGGTLLGFLPNKKGGPSNDAVSEGTPELR